MECAPCLERVSALLLRPRTRLNGFLLSAIKKLFVTRQDVWHDIGRYYSYVPPAVAETEGWSGPVLTDAWGQTQRQLEATGIHATISACDRHTHTLLASMKWCGNISAASNAIGEGGFSHTGYPVATG